MSTPISSARSPNVIQRGTRKLAQAVQAVKQGTAQLLMPDALNLTTAQKLGEGNKRALNYAVDTLTATISHPWETLKNTFKAIKDVVVYPEKALEQVVSAFKKNPVEGLVAGGNLFATYGGLAAVALSLGALIAAPFTGGGSLALLSVATTIGSAAGASCLGAMGVSFFKNQVDVANAKTVSELEKESRELGDDYTNVAITAMSAGVDKGIEKGLKMVKPNSVAEAALRAREATKAKNLPIDEICQEALQEAQGSIFQSLQTVPGDE